MRMNILSRQSDFGNVAYGANTRLSVALLLSAFDGGAQLQGYGLNPNRSKHLNDWDLCLLLIVEPYRSKYLNEWEGMLG